MITDSFIKDEIEYGLAKIRFYTVGKRKPGRFWKSARLVLAKSLYLYKPASGLAIAVRLI
jgi:hypothetical protein